MPFWWNHFCDICVVQAYKILQNCQWLKKPYKSKRLSQNVNLNVKLCSSTTYVLYFFVIKQGKTLKHWIHLYDIVKKVYDCDCV